MLGILAYAYALVKVTEILKLVKSRKLHLL